MRPQLVGPSANLVLIAAMISCGGDSAEPAETILIPPPETAPTSPASPAAGPSNAESSTIQAPPRATSTTTTLTPDHASAPTSNGDPESAVLAAVGSAEQAYVTALRDPDTDGVPRIEAATAAGSPVRDELVGRYRARIAAGFVLEPIAATPFAISVEGDVELLASARRARVTVCVVDGDVLLRRGVSADGEEERIIVNDIVIAARYSQEFVLDEGVWRLSSRTLINASEGESSCVDFE